MAERGVDYDDNPFSFKAFVQGKDKSKDDSETYIFDEDNDLFLSEESNQKKKYPARPAPDEKPQMTKSKPKENPFSFKTYIGGSSNSTADKKKRSSSPFTSGGPPDIAVDIPQFVPNHFCEGHNDKKTLDYSKKKSSNLKTSNSLENSSDFISTSDSDVHGYTAALSVPFCEPDNALFIEDEPDKWEKGDHDSPERKSSGGFQLPDFLADGPLLNANHGSKLESIDTGTLHEDLLTRVRELQDENHNLRSELAREKQKCSEKNKRLTQIKHDLERQKKKEAEETAVMEKAIEQVEENLVTTTKRAVEAESVVTNLKQEVKSLQAQVKSLQAENAALTSEDGGLSDIRERTKYSADELKIAARSAEQNLKELMRGVDKLKLMSQVLSSWEKIAEVKSNSASATADEAKPL